MAAKYRKTAAVLAERFRLYNVDDLTVKIFDITFPVYREKGEVFIMIPNLEGNLKAKEGDMIIQGIKGELYPCDGNIFSQTYELVKE